MSFLHTWPIVLGLAAAALPVAIHFLTRPRPAPFPFSTIRFLREVVQQRRAHQRLRDLLILALRIAAVTLLAWALARPLFGQQSLVVDDPNVDVARVVLLDASQSMAAGDHGIQAFERARAMAAEHLAYNPRVRANLIDAAASAKSVFDGASTNFAALRDRIADVDVRPERLNVRAALARAATMLAEQSATSTKRELVVISDFQRANWSAADFSGLPQKTRIVLQSVAPAETPANLAVLSVGCQGRAMQDGVTRCQIQFGNFSPNERKIEFELTIGEISVRRQAVCPARQTTLVTEDVTLRAAGWQAGVCRISDAADALAADDSRSFVVHVRSALACALITRQDSGGSLSTSFYLERALSPLIESETSQGVRVARYDPAQLDDEGLSTADLLVLDHPGKLTEASARKLSAILHRGRALLYVVSEPADAVNLKQLALAAGADLQMPVEFSPTSANNVRRDLFLVDVRRDRPPFSVFGDGLVEQISPLRFSGGLASRRRGQGSEDDILAVYSDRSAALVLSSCGAGMLAVLNVDLNNSNLPSSPAFVPLIGELVEQLTTPRTQHPTVASGEPSVIYLPPEAGDPAGLRVIGPAGNKQSDASEITSDQLGVMWRTSAVGLPGVWRIDRGGRAVFAAASVIPAEESDLSSLDANVLTQRISGGRKIEYRGSHESNNATDDTWTWLAAACLAIMLVELVALRTFRA